MKELGIIMDLWSQTITIDDITLPMITYHLQGAGTLNLQKLDGSLAKDPISTHAKHATRTLYQRQKADLQSIVKCNCKHLSANRQRSYCSSFNWYELSFDGTLDGWKNKPVSFQWKVSTTHHGQAFPVSKIHKIPSPKRLRGCVYLGYWSSSKHLTERCLHL